jgi:subtilisin family serine protease
MSPARSASRPFALAAAAVLVAVTAVPAGAASPNAGASALRHLGHAWDRPTADDPGRLIVTFRPGTTALGRTAALRPTGARATADLPGTSSVALRAVEGRERETVATLRADPRVLRVGIDHRRYRSVDPAGEPYWGELWGLENTGQNIYQGYPGTGGSPDADIDARQAIGITTGDPSTVVAVIDDGVDLTHPDLGARAWSNPGESGAGRETNGIDDDANGYVDDVHGWDFCHNDNTVHDFDQDFHGTHVAGTIAASLNGIGVVGVAPNVSIMALKFISDDRPRDCGLDSQAIAAIAYAKSFGVHIANASWGESGRRDSAPDLYEAIAKSQMLFVAAAGNSDEDMDDPQILPSIPAAFDLPNIVSVAAIDNSGGLAGFSNYGLRSVDIAAPGEAVLSSLPADPKHSVGWGWMDGTSMAAPHVSGTAALIASVFPSLAADPNALKARLLSTGKPDAATSGMTATGRLVDAFRSLDTIGPVARAPSSFGFVVGATMGRTTISTRVAWVGATDDRSGVAAYGLQARAGGGSWSTVFASSTAHTAIRTLTFGTPYAFRDRARDRAGNWGAYATAPPVTALRYQDTSSRITYSRSWRGYSTSSASGGHTRYATRSGAAATFRFTGRGFALIAPKGPTRGSARLYVDGVYISTVSLNRSSTSPRVVVAGRSWSTSAAHSVKLVVVGTARHPRFDIDAFAVLR